MSNPTPPTALQAAPNDTRWLRESFVQVQAALRLKLEFARQSISHAGTQGAVNEGNWIEVLRAYLPDRYVVDQAIVVDSLGNRSDQIDVVVFDRQFTPVLLQQNNHRLVPAEAVYAVFECKPEFNKEYIEYAGKKAQSVRELHRTSNSFGNAGTTNSAKPLIPITAGLLAPRAIWQDGLGDSFKSHLPTDQNNKLNCGCALDHGAFDTYDNGMLHIVPAECSLIYFLFKLVSRLQAVGTAPAADWMAYAKIVES